MAANLEDVPSLDLMHELLRRMKCSSKPDKRLILIGTAWTDLSLSPITFLLAGAWSIRRSRGTGRERPPLVDVLIRDPREVFSFHEEPWFFFFCMCGEEILPPFWMSGLVRDFSTDGREIVC